MSSNSDFIAILNKYLEDKDYYKFRKDIKDDKIFNKVIKLTVFHELYIEYFTNLDFIEYDLVLYQDPKQYCYKQLYTIEKILLMDPL